MGDPLPELPEDSEELYDDLLYIYSCIYSGGRIALEGRIGSLMKQGLSRNQAIHKLAEKEILEDRRRAERLNALLSAFVDKSVLKDWRLLLFIPLMYLLYGLAVLLPMCSLVFNIQWAADLAFTIIFILTFVLAFLSDPLRRLIQFARLRDNKMLWLRLHVYLTISSLVFSLLVMLPIAIWLVFKAPENVRAYHLAWSLATIGLFPYCLKALKRIVGMSPVNLGGDSIIGSRAFAMLAGATLHKKETKGIGYLDHAIQMLESSLLSEGITIANLGKVSLALESFRLLDTEADFNRLEGLSKSLGNSIDLKDIVESTDQFLGKNSDWHRKVSRAEGKRSNGLLPKAMTLGVTIVSALAALFSEELKKQLSSLLLGIWWPDILITIAVIIMYFFFMRSYTSLASRLLDPRDLVKVDMTDS